jgi:hypothetical protein
MLKKNFLRLLLIVKLYLRKCVLGYEGLNPGLLRCAKLSCHHWLQLIHYSQQRLILWKYADVFAVDDNVILWLQYILKIWLSFALCLKEQLRENFAVFFRHWSPLVVLCHLERNFSNICMDTVNHDANILGWGNVHVVFILSLKKPAVDRGEADGITPLISPPPSYPVDLQIFHLQET